MSYFHVKTSDGLKRVRCWETCSSYFVITPTVGSDKLYGRYALTHRRSRMAAAFSNKRKMLRLMAGILGALPVPWGVIQSSRGVKAPWLALPLSVQKWWLDFTRSP
jgi:hypothetical protein